MNSKAHFNPKSMKWIISLVVMIALSAGVIFGSRALYSLANGKYDDHYDVPSIASTQDIDISGKNTSDYGVTAVSEALDASGTVVAYVVTGEIVGYNTDSPIEMTTTVSADGALICGVDILSQNETEYLGVRIENPDFKAQFEGRLIPVVSSTSTDTGSRIDVISGSTISSEAVIDGVGNAVDFLVNAGMIEITAE